MRIADNNEPIPKKLRRLLLTAGFGELDLERKFVAIKMHFGEGGNLAYLRPNYAKVLVDLVKEAGGRPFLTDCNTLYPGRRKNALEHLDLAYEHGFSPFSTGCQILIGDGLSGSDEALVPVVGGEYIKEAKIGRAVMDADVFISLNHFKGHIETGFGGALKNIGMGCGSRAGKMEMHSATHPKVKEDVCIGCRKCARFCGSDAISYPRRKAQIDPQTCVGCGHCIAACPVDAIYSAFDEENEIVGAKIAEYAKAVLDGRPHFHVNLVIDVSPLCDCFGASDLPIVPNVGMFASSDPVALDAACVAAVNAQRPNEGSLLAERLRERREHVSDNATDAADSDRSGDEPNDHFKVVNEHSNWIAQLTHAKKIGLGNTDYELIEV
jgi:uncharacterized Fe-S center protein